MQRVFGIVFSGFMCRLYGAALALYTVSYAYAEITRTFGAIAKLPI